MWGMCVCMCVYLFQNFGPLFRLVQQVLCVTRSFVENGLRGKKTTLFSVCPGLRLTRDSRGASPYLPLEDLQGLEFAFEVAVSHFELGQQHIDHLGDRTQALVKVSSGRRADEHRRPLPHWLPVAWSSSHLWTARPGSLLDHKSQNLVHSRGGLTLQETQTLLRSGSDWGLQLHPHCEA